MRHLLEPVQGSDMVKGVNAGTESAVQAEDLSVHESREGQVVEQVCEVLPNIGVPVLPETLVVEAVHLRDLAGLVVAAQNGDALAEADLKRRKTEKNNSGILILGRENNKCMSAQVYLGNDYLVALTYYFYFFVFLY